jgi:hypothetical protein
MNMVDANFYVYACYVDEALWIVGKGTGRRDRKHLARAKRAAKGLPLHRLYRWQADLAVAISNGATVRISRLAEGLSEDAALSVRQEANDAFGSA